MFKSLIQAVPRRLRATLRLRAFGLARIPMLFFISPTVQEVSDDRIVVKVPLNRRTRNHWGSMYFGALAAGADCACGLLAVSLIEEDPLAKGRVSLIFKDFHAEFFKRAEGDVHFICEQGAEIRKLIQSVVKSGSRENLLVDVIATVPKKLGQEAVARFQLTLSLKFS
jgi:acyl-coenzyme A thioesterase PaaI-like protein